MQDVSKSAPKLDTPPTLRRSVGRRSRGVKFLIAACLVAAVAVAIVFRLGSLASTVRTEVQSAAELIPAIKAGIQEANAPETESAVEKLRYHTGAANIAAADPLWKLAAYLPWLGPNFSAVTEVARSADDVANLGLLPLVDTLGSLEWGALLPSASSTDLAPLKAASPGITSAAYSVRLSAARLEQIDETMLLPEVAAPLTQAREQLQEAAGALDKAADASELLPVMLGTETPRSYLLMIQNNAEARASGGIPGALAILTADNGTLSFGEQSSAGDVGTMVPELPLDLEQRAIYSGRLGKFMQDVNLTPDFPSAAAVAQGMWERKTGRRVDGVLSLDPVTLAYILDATGPIKLNKPEANRLSGQELPTELTGNNVVQTLLSDVYAKIEDPGLQDAYFAGVAKEVFSSLSDGKADARGMIDGIIRGTREGRVLLWSAHSEDQDVLMKYPLSGSIAGPSVAPAQFGVYFNDGTGAKMDFYVRRTVQLTKECDRDGYEQTTVRVTSTNTAPADAATSLPAYVTGAGIFGVPSGSVQTNIVAYGPVQANIETAKVDGQKTSFAPYLHSNRPVGVLAIRLAPGESRTVDFTFGKIVQHTEPNVVVTPTVQDVKDVILATKNSICGS